MAEFIISSKGGRKLVLDNFIYCKNKTLTNGNTYWECDERRSKNGCNVKVTLDQEENFLRQFGEHTHVACPESVEAERMRSRIKRAARDTNERANNIIAETVAGANEVTLAKLPKLDTMRRDIRRQRAAQAVYPAIPEDNMFDIPHPFDLTAAGEQFLQYDNQRNDRMLIFGSRESLDFLQNSSHWFMDGTFSTVPPEFAQLYTVHGLNHGRHVIGAYSLLANKRLETYTDMLNQIQLLTNHVNPESVMTDFEQSMIGAWSRVYPLVPHKGCLFHLSKNIYRRVQESGLSEMYINDDVFRTNIRMISAISFVPIEDTIQAFNELSNHAGNQEQVILDYFETNYIGELRRGRRLQPRFPHAMWNTNVRVHDELPRTNNDLEGWHNRFSTSFSHHHAHVWRFIEGLQHDSTLNHHTMAQVILGAPIPPQRRIYRDINQRIQTLVDGYQNNNIIDFLRGISYNLA